MDSNPGPLVLKTTALSIVPQLGTVQHSHVANVVSIKKLIFAIKP